MGDIDVLISVYSNSEGENREILSKFVRHMTVGGYITTTLSLGSHKFMGIAKLPFQKKLRRIDILITTKDELPFAELYFTGSYESNIQLRKEAIERGYTLNEKSLSKDGEKILLNSETEIFDFFGYFFIPPYFRIPAKMKCFKKSLYKIK